MSHVLIGHYLPIYLLPGYDTLSQELKTDFFHDEARTMPNDQEPLIKSVIPINR